uniref:Uncharacterized protein n=1 Tax=Dunaliella viridis TaxID=140095 RepID=D1FV82_9CHLO|nr:hypothetical protein [Dunaliella viridis]
MNASWNAACVNTPVNADSWGFSQMGQFNSLKMSIIGGIHAAQYFRPLLIIFNVIVILVKLIFG